MKESGNHDEIVGEYNVNFGRENNPPSILGILDFGSLCTNSLREAPNAPNFGFWRRILDFGDFGFWGFWILGSLDFGFWGRNPKSKIQNPQSLKSKIPKIRPKKLGFWGFWILDFWDFGDFGFWIVGILDFGDFGDFGFWIFGILGILDFGFLEHYVADLYVQSLDFGIWRFWILGILDLGFWTGDFGWAPCDKILDAT